MNNNDIFYLYFYLSGGYCFCGEEVSRWLVPWHPLQRLSGIVHILKNVSVIFPDIYLPLCIYTQCTCHCTTACILVNKIVGLMLILVWLKNLKKGCNVDFFFFFVIIRLVVFQGILLRKIQVKLEIGKSKLITSHF